MLFNLTEFSVKVQYYKAENTDTNHSDQAGNNESLDQVKATKQREFLGSWPRSNSIIFSRIRINHDFVVKSHDQGFVCVVEEKVDEQKILKLSENCSPGLMFVPAMGGAITIF